MKLRLTGAAMLAVLATWTRAETTIRSGPGRVTLIELYTSEGCSSCPPAEKWLGSLRADPGLWKAFVPVAFHVNYWDHLGWRDRLASDTFTQREYAHAAAWRSASVYTPCFVCNGEEWRPQGVTSADLASADKDHRGTRAGALTIVWQSDRTCRVDYSPPAGVGISGAGLDVSVALLGSGIITKVRAGENRGRDLGHDFAVLQFETAALKSDNPGRLTATVVVPPRADVTARRHAISAWVTRRGDPAPLQAAGGWIE